MSVRLLPIVPHEPLGDTARFVRGLSLDLNQKNGIDKFGRLLRGMERNPSTNWQTGLERRGKANFIQTVIDGHGHTRTDVDCLPEKVRQQRKRQKTVSNGTAEWRFALRTLRVEMNPLVILGGLGKLADACLSDNEPIGRGKFASFAEFQGIQILNFKRRHREFS
jgi:hypothetical protein